MLLSYTVLSELYQKKLVTEDEVKWMKGGGGYLPNQLIPIMSNKQPEVRSRTADVLDKFKYHESARKLRG